MAPIVKQLRKARVEVFFLRFKGYISHDTYKVLMMSLNATIFSLGNTHDDDEDEGDGYR